MINSADILKASILIVDDLEANVQLLARMLASAGYTSVVSTMDPRKVYELHLRDHYDLILLDLMMPGMDGFEVMEGLKKIEEEGYLPVLVITAQPDHKLRALKAGARDFVSKPFDLAEVLARVHNMLEVRLLHKELHNYNAELEQRVQNRTAAISQEIDVRKRAEIELQFRNLLLTTQQEVSIDGIRVVDESGKIISFNRRFIEMWEIPPQIIESLSYDQALQWAISKVKKPEEFLARIQYLYSHKEEKSRDEISLLDGRTFDRYSSPMFGEDGKYYGRVWYYRDMTERKQLEEKLRGYAEDLEVKVSERTRQLEDANNELQILNDELTLRRQEAEEAKARADAATQAKSDFLANMSHELRTPLNSIIGFSEVLQDELIGPLNAPQLEDIQYILLAGRHLLSLINDILDLSKVESGKMELESEALSLGEALKASLVMQQEKAMKHSIVLSLEITPEVDIEIEADARKLKQIMFNLLSNAVKFTPDGGTVSMTAIKLSETEEIEISVSDTGIGIKSDDMPRLFHEFTQLQTAYSKEYEGTGLGLALTKKLVELHGGRIWVESEIGKGSRFAFVIPVKQRKEVNGQLS